MTIHSFGLARAAVVAIAVAMSLGAGVSAAQAAITTSEITSPADGTLMFNNGDTDPSKSFTVTGTTDGTSADGDAVDIVCYHGGTAFRARSGQIVSYDGPNGAGIPVGADGSFSTSVPMANFDRNSCELLAVPHGTTPSNPAGLAGPRVGFSYFFTFSNINGSATHDDFEFNEQTATAEAGVDSIDDCGPFAAPVDGTPALNVGPRFLDCVGDFYNSQKDFRVGNDLSQGEIQVDAHNAYGATSAAHIDASISGQPPLTASLDRFDPATGDAQTTESEPLVECSPNPTNDYAPTSGECTSFVSSGVSVTRVTSFTGGGRVQTVSDTFTSTDGRTHALDLQYEDDLNSAAAGWQLPGDTGFSQHNTNDSAPAPPTSPGTVYAIYDTAQSPSLADPVAALTFDSPYTNAQFDDTLWPHQVSALFAYTRTVPAGGSTTITWSYATGTTLAEVQADAAAARAAIAPTVPAPAPKVTPAHARKTSTVRISHVRLREHPKTELSFKLSRRANVRLVLQARVRGHLVQLAVKTMRARRGANNFAVSARWHAMLRPHRAMRILLQLKPGRTWVTERTMKLTVRGERPRERRVGG